MNKESIDEMVSLIDEKLVDLKNWMDLENAMYSQDYEKKRAQFSILKDLKKEVQGRLSD